MLATIKFRPYSKKAGLALLLLALITAAALDRIFPADLQAQYFAQTVVDQDGVILRQFADQNGQWRYQVELDEVSPKYIQALLTYEDRWFYQHPGVNPVAMGRALVQTIWYQKPVSGASTLTMQVARLRYQIPSNVSGKLLQMARALQLESRYSKQDILTFYLNHAPFGGTLQGVEAASRGYLGRSSKRLTWSDAALLAGLPQAPSYLRPDRHPKRAEKQRNKVLQRLAHFDVIDNNQVESAKLEQVYATGPTRQFLAPLLSRKLVRESSSALLKTTIDAQLQSQVQRLAQDHKSRLPAGTSIALLVMEHGTGKVKAHLGSADFFDDERYGHVDMVEAMRSPGSALKPFVYGLALDKGLIHSKSLLIDTPLIFDDYVPVNFDRGFSGPVSAARALSASLNVPAVQLLAHLGANVFYTRLQNAGLELQLPAKAKPSLAIALGGISIKLEKLVSLHSSLANQGRVLTPIYLRDQQPESNKLLSAESAWIVRQILLESDPQSNLAIKTGTSSSYRDTWALAVDRHYSYGVWIGHPANQALVGHAGAVTAVPFLKRVAQLTSSKHTSKHVWHNKPETVQQVPICWPSGRLKTTETLNCDQTHLAWTINQTTPHTLSANPAQFESGLLAFRINPANGKRVDFSCATKSVSQKIAVWPMAMQSYLPSHWQTAKRLPDWQENCGLTGQRELSETDEISITGIENGDVLRSHQSSRSSQTLQLVANSVAEKWHWFINGKRLEDQQNKVLELPQPAPGFVQIAVLDSEGRSGRVQFIWY